MVTCDQSRSRRLFHHQKLLYATIPSACPLSLVQLLSRVRLFATSWTAACQASLSITNSWSLLKLMSIVSIPSPPAFNFPSVRIFSNELPLHIRCTKYWNFSFSNSPSNEYSGLISFKIDRFDLLAVQGTLKSLLQHHTSKASIL